MPLPEQRAQWVKERQAPRWAVAVVGVTAAVLVLVAFKFGLFDSSGSQDLATTPTTTAASTPAGTTGVTQPPPVTTPSAAAASTAAKPGGPSVVPAVFLGTWSGEMTSEKGLPAGTTTLVIGPAAIGQENTTSRNAVTGLLSVSCEGAWTLNSASPEKLVFTSRLVRSSIPGACTGGSNAETLTLQSDGTICFTSADPPAGNPAGTMRRAG